MLKALENISAIYANPTRFMGLAAKLHAPLWGVAAICAWPMGCIVSLMCPMITSRARQ